MFDIGWSELLLIGVVALIAIGPKELPGVLRMVGQWMGKIRRMASDFQGQFQEAMREAEVADVKKQFDDVTSAARNVTSGNVMTELQKDVEKAFEIPDVRPVEPAPPSFSDLAPPERAASPPAAPEAGGKVAG